jgi:hypothetical protein
MKQYYQDVIIFGGGICGVWTDAFLRAGGYSSILLEKNTIGGTQTILSQGIIHKGLKYLLGREIPKIAALLSKNAKIWDEALSGGGPIDLSKAEVYTQKQLLWNAQNFLSSFFAKTSTKLFRSEVEKIEKTDIPDWLTYQPKNIFWLKERVLNIHSMMKIFYEKNKKHYYHYDLEEKNFSIEKKENLIGLKLPKEKIILWTKKIILAAGAGNEKFAKLLDIPCRVQLRALNMIALEHNYPLQIYGHCITASSKPLFTLSSHPKKNGKMLWYLGGKIAELKNAEPQALAKILQKNIRIHLKDATWKSFCVDRAEPWQKNGLLPEKPFIKDYNKAMICFPVKLAFAPWVALEVQKKMQENGILPHFSDKKIPELRPIKLASAFYESS